MNREQIYRGLSKVAWGYVFLTFILNLGTLNVLPTGRATCSSWPQSACWGRNCGICPC